MTQLLKQQKSLQNWPMRYHSLIFALAITLTASALLGLPLVNSAIDHLDRQAQHSRHTLAKQASYQAADAIFSQDLLSLNVILSTLVQHEAISYVAIYDLNNELLAEKGHSQSLDSQPMSIQYQNQVIGLLEIQLSNEALQSAYLQLYLLWLVLSVLLCTLAGIAAWLVGSRLGRQLKQTAQDIRQLNQADKGEQNIHRHPWGELKLVSDQLAQHQQHQMHQHAVQSALARFTSANGVEPMQNPKHYSESAILFIELCELNQAQAALPALELAQLLNQYYHFIHQAAQLYNGTVEKYQGDGVMILFGIPQHDEQDGFHGICAALLLQGLLKQFNQQRHQQKLTTLQFKLAVHKGNVLVSTLGEGQHLSYSIMGAPVHEAAHLCHQGELDKVLVSQAVLQQGHLSGQLSTSPCEPLSGLSAEQSMSAFWIDALSPNTQALIDRQIQHIASHEASTL